MARTMSDESLIKIIVHRVKAEILESLKYTTFRGLLQEVEEVISEIIFIKGRAELLERRGIELAPPIQVMQSRLDSVLRVRLYFLARIKTRETERLVKRNNTIRTEVATLVEELQKQYSSTIEDSKRHLKMERRINEVEIGKIDRLHAEILTKAETVLLVNQDDPTPQCQCKCTCMKKSSSSS